MPGSCQPLAKFRKNMLYALGRQESGARADSGHGAIHSESTSIHAHGGCYIAAQVFATLGCGSGNAVPHLARGPRRPDPQATQADCFHSLAPPVQPRKNIPPAVYFDPAMFIGLPAKFFGILPYMFVPNGNFTMCSLRFAAQIGATTGGASRQPMPFWPSLPARSKTLEM